MTQEYRQVPLAKPILTIEDREAVNEVLKGTCLSMGPKVEEFEDVVAKYVGSKHAIAVNSGTSALHLCVRAGMVMRGLKRGDRVVTSPFTFMATAGCFMQEGLIPYFVDIDPSTMNADMKLVSKAIEDHGIKAMVIPDIFGMVPDYADEYPDVFFVEDSAEALGASRWGRMAGTFGDCGVFAFYGNKQITTGEGGMIVTDNDEIDRLCRMMRNQGRNMASHTFEHRMVGYNYRMAEMPAALGVSQMSRIDSILASRRQSINRYRSALDGNTLGIRLVPGLQSNEVSPFVCAVTLPEMDAGTLISLIDVLTARGVGCRNYFPHLANQEAVIDVGYQLGAGTYAFTASATTIALPLYEGMFQSDIIYVCSVLKEEVGRLHNVIGSGV